MSNLSLVASIENLARPAIPPLKLNLCANFKFCCNDFKAAAPLATVLKR
jgi:hypothetical protein